MASLLLCITLTLVFAASPAHGAMLTARIDLSTQTMTLTQDEAVLHVWQVSTGTHEFRTPTGTFRPTRLQRNWHSRTYDDAPMPFSIFFTGGYAIHGTLDVRSLGRPASRGCVRLNLGNAEILYELVKQYGIAMTRIIVEN